MQSIRITSDGTTQGTRVTTPEGEELQSSITKIEILPMVGSGDVVKAVITFTCVSRDVVAEMAEK